MTTPSTMAGVLGYLLLAASCKWGTAQKASEGAGSVASSGQNTVFWALRGHAFLQDILNWDAMYDAASLLSVKSDAPVEEDVVAYGTAS